MRYALVSGTSVENAIEWDGTSQYVPPAGLTAVADPTDTVGPGWTYNGTTFVAPVVVQPTLTAAQAAQGLYNAALAAGVNLTWSSSTALNGTYDIDKDTQSDITAETVSLLLNNTFTNGQTTRNWLDYSFAAHSFTIAQFKAFSTAIALYVDALIMAQSMAGAGQTATWPSANITINL